MPLIKELRSEIGEERAYAIARKALGNWARDIGHRINEKTPGEPIKKIAAKWLSDSAGDALDIDVLLETADTYDINITRCRYAEFYKNLGEPELGFLFVCAQDHSIAKGINPDLELIVTQTIMEGADRCEFRYKLKNANNALKNDA